MRRPACREILTEPFFLMNGRYLADAVVLIPGLVTGAVSEGDHLAITVPDHILFAAGGVLHGTGQLILRAGIKPAAGIAPREVSAVSRPCSSYFRRVLRPSGQVVSVS
jgi:hypothetical protein